MTYTVTVNANTYVIDDNCIIEVQENKVRIYKRGTVQAASEAVSNKVGNAPRVEEPVPPTAWKARYAERPRVGGNHPGYVHKKETWGNGPKMTPASTREELVTQIMAAVHRGGKRTNAVAMRGVSLNTNTGLSGAAHKDYLHTVIRELVEEGKLETFLPEDSTLLHYRITQPAKEGEQAA